VKVKVFDATGEAVFVVFDGDVNNLLGHSCGDLLSLSKVCAIFICCVFAVYSVK
jgi:hypothetical protein